MGPIPSIVSDRKIGLELEYDASYARFNFPLIPEGWSRHSDGSLLNGVEVVLDPPLLYQELVEKVRELSRLLVESRTYCGVRGGMHVHVGVADFDIKKCVNLSQIYAKFQPVINKLVALSRVNNHFCKPFSGQIDEASLIRMFNLGIPARTRYEAKATRDYRVINFAMFRCVDPQHRTVEFRQGSISRRADCICGWVAFVATLTDLACLSSRKFSKLMSLPPTLEGLVDAMNMASCEFGSSGLAEWVKWRFDYINQEPTQDLVNRAVSCVGENLHGIFYVSEELGINLSLAKKTMEMAHSQGLVERVGLKYRARSAS